MEETNLHSFIIMTKTFNKNQKDISFILITFNEAHNLERCIKNLTNISRNIYVLDSYSKDDTVTILKQNKIVFKQNKFKNFGDQWNLALKIFNIKTKWIMKIDPDEFIDDDLKNSILNLDNLSNYNGLYVKRYPIFMGKRLLFSQKELRIWRAGECRFSSDLVNEYPIVNGKCKFIKGKLLHYDSPNLDHWLTKQNHYANLQAKAILDNKFEKKATNRKHLFRKIFYKIPFKYFILYLFHLIFYRAIFLGKTGLIWARLRVFVYQLMEYKLIELKQKKR